MYKCLEPYVLCETVRNQMTFPANLRHRHGLPLTRPAVSFWGGTKRESGGNRAYLNA